jgi:hypothetical protein
MTNVEIAGRGVLVLGMHRSGTSAITHLLHLGGLACGRHGRSDRGGPANPRGFWEVEGLTRLNEALLRALDGEWSAPPDLVAGWERDPRLQGLRKPSARMFRRSMPDAGWVWKDPRLCLTTPFWESLGVGIGAIVLAVRNPLEVCASLAARNGFDARLSLALWERHARGAVQIARGSPTVVVDFDTIEADPIAWVTSAIGWLGSEIPIPDRGRADRVASVFEEGLRHTRRTMDELMTDQHVSSEQSDLYAALRASQGFHRAGLRVPLPPSTQWVSATIADRRRARRDARQGAARWNHRTHRAVMRALVGARDLTAGSLRHR